MKYEVAGPRPAIIKHEVVDKMAPLTESRPKTRMLAIPIPIRAELYAAHAG